MSLPKADEPGNLLPNGIPSPELCLGAILQAVTDEVWIVDAQGKVLMVNEAVRSNLGVLPERWPDVYSGIAELETLRPDGTPRPAHEAPFVRCLNGNVVENQLEIVRRLGTEDFRWREVAGAPLRATDGTVTGAVIIVRDITERKRAETANQATEVRYRQLFETMQEGFFLAEIVCNASGQPVDYRFLDVNPALELMTGLRRSDLIGHLVTEALPGVDQYWIDLFGAVATTGKPGHFENYSTPLDRWYEAHAYSPQPGLFATTLLDTTERKRSEEELRIRERELTKSQAAVHLGSWSWNLRNGSVNWSDELYRIFAVDPGTLMPSNDAARQMIHPDDRLAHEEMLKVALAGKPTGPFESRIVRPSGDERKVLSSGFEVEFDSDGRPATLFGTVLDITERKSVEATLRESEENYRALFDNAADPIFIVGEQGRILAANLAAITVYGYTHDELLAMDIADLDALEKGAPELRRTPHIVREGKLYFKAVHRRKDGHCLTVEVNAQRITWRGQAAAMGICRDVTERVRTEEILRESEARFRTLADHISQLAWMAEPDGYRTWFNKRWYDYTGTTLEDARGWGWKTVHHPDQIDSVAQNREHCVRTGQPWEDTVLLRREDGVFRWFLSRVVPIRDEDGRIVMWFGTDTDITDLRDAEEERVRLEAQFVQAQKMESIGRLAGGVAHDFNNLLTVINGYSQLIVAELRPGDPLRARAEEIYKAGERASGLTRQLLAFSRKQVLQPQTLHLNGVIEELHKMLKRMVGEDVDVVLVLSADDPVVSADRVQFEQVIMNLVVNARDAMPRGGRLVIETSIVEREASAHVQDSDGKEGRFALLAISDTGVGMDEVTQERIFEPFFTTKEIGQGTGLGLSTVQGIVEQSGGHIAVLSHPGQGTTFKIYIPALSHKADRIEKQPELPATLRGNEVILVVEDQDEVRHLAVTVLKLFGYRVMHCSNAGEALLVVEREGARIDLVLTDIVMPNMSGLQLIERINKSNPHVKSLFISGYADDVIAHHGPLDTNINLLQKPFSPAELAGKVRAILGPAAHIGRILVADGDSGVRAIVRTILEAEGYEVVQGADIAHALHQAQARGFDVVITDRQDDRWSVQALRRQLPDVAIIATSGGHHDCANAGGILDADAVLKKPIVPASLLSTVAEVLKGRRS